MSKSSVVRVIGLMSGTSMDGIDAALIETDGEAIVKPIEFVSVPYDEAFRARLRQALGDATAITARDQRPGCLADVERELTDRHAAVVGDLTKGHAVDLIAFHGQTVLHRPEDRVTLQLGDGQRLADASGVPVIYDMRAADVAAGGQGAPLAPAYHRAMVAQAGERPTAVLNIGGVANVTFIARNGRVKAFDTGPGNALIDDWVFGRTGTPIDKSGALALAGRADTGLVAAMLADPYFAQKPPKSLDRNAFAARHLSGLSTEDGAATLAAFTVGAIAAAVQHAEEKPERWIVCGGGRHNAALMGGLRDNLNAEVCTAEDAGFDGDAIEAQAWAYLGARAAVGKPISFPGTTGVPQDMTGGVLATPGPKTCRAGP